MSDIKIALLNLNGAGDIRKRMDDVMFVQEKHSDRFSDTDWWSAWDR